MTWSNTKETQHLNPLSVEDFENLMIENNFVVNDFAQIKTYIFKKK